MSSYLQKLIGQKNKIQQKLESALDKRCEEVTDMLKKTDLLTWSNPALKALFQSAEEKTESHYVALVKPIKRKKDKVKNAVSSQETAAKLDATPQKKEKEAAECIPHFLLLNTNSMH